jgi:hypothetical protein
LKKEEREELMTFEEAGASSLEQFTLLAKNARGRACVALIQQALSNKKLYVFRELLDMPNVQGLRGTEHEEHLQLLEIFCFGKYADYMGREHSHSVRIAHRWSDLCVFWTG